MSWYYADAGRQIGPVEESALDDLVRAGVVRDDTLVWRDGMSGWQPHGAVRGVRPPPAAMPIPAAAAAGSGFCSECGRPFPSNQLVMIGNASVCAQCKPVFMQRVREGGQGIAARRYAGFWIRVVAAIIDAVILSVAGLIINVPLQMAIGVSAIQGAANPSMAIGLFGIVALINIAIGCAYATYMISSRGGTLGMLAVSLRVIKADGSQLTTGQALGRYFAYMINAFTMFIGFIIIAFDDQKRALHDRICDTRVIYSR
jgi:uncharacterized RDD family membrane protein YckC